MHCSVPFFSDYDVATLWQYTFISYACGFRLGFEKNLDAKLKALCEANGVKFKKR